MTWLWDKGDFFFEITDELMYDVSDLVVLNKQPKDSDV